MRLAPAVLWLLAAVAFAAEGPALTWPNAGFEDGLTGWSVQDAMCSLSEEQAAEGQRSLKVVDASTQDGSNTLGPVIPVTGGQVYLIKLQVYPVSGSGLGLYTRVLDRDGKILGDVLLQGAPYAPAGKWLTAQIMVGTPPEAAAIQFWHHTYSHAVVTAYVDDFAIAPMLPGQRPWPAQYKLRAGDRDKLTAADVVGPDGLVYPDWRQAGVPGGIPTVPVRVRAEECGAVPDDDRDDTPAIQAALDRAGEQGGGAVLLGPGVYQLDERLVIRRDGVVLRGSGRDRTRLMFRYDLGPEGLRWAAPKGDALYRNSAVVLHARPAKLERLTVRVGDQVIATKARSENPHWGNTFSLAASVGNLLKAVPPTAATVTLTGEATYAGGERHQITRTLTIRREGSDPDDYRRAPDDYAIAFSGDAKWWRSKPIALTADGRRGDTTLALASAEGLKAGDWIAIQGPATPRWKELTRNACQWGEYRRNMLQLTAVDGTKVTLAQPLRIEFPVIDGSRIWKIDPIRGCGLEDLTIEQVHDLWMNTAVFSAAVGCWARGVKVVKCGRNPVYGAEAKQCTIADCEFDDAWFKGGGGTAYAGWEFSYDCLMTDCVTRKLRHAPLVQWSASGNVIRRSTFYESDAQWHSGWTNENLFEQCRVIAVTGNGAYGYGAWASPPEDTAHGPNGPRNVVYNCDISSPKTGLWMGGMNEGWMILHNRFVVEAGAGVYARNSSFDHTIAHNVIVLKRAGSAALELGTPDCLGIEFYGNRIYGERAAVTGPVRPEVLRDNVVEPLGDAPRPTPAVPSIYEWQLQHAGSR